MERGRTVEVKVEPNEDGEFEAHLLEDQQMEEDDMEIGPTELTKPAAKQIAMEPRSRASPGQFIAKYMERSPDSRHSRVSYAQLEAMWSLLNSNRDVAMGSNKSAHARTIAKKVWENVADTLNNLEGANRDGKGWSLYWIDYKAKLKRKLAAIKQSRTEPDGPYDTSSLNDVEKKFCNMIGLDTKMGLPNLLLELDSIPEIQSVSPKTESNEPANLQNESSKPFPTITVPLENYPTVESVQIQQAESSTNGNVAKPIIRRRRRPNLTPYTQETARRTLIESAQTRINLETRNSNTLEGILSVLSRIASSFERIERRLDATSDD